MCLLRIFLFASLRLPIRHFPTPDSQHQCRSSGSTRADAERQCRASHRPESTRSSAREQRPGADGNVIDTERSSALALGRGIGDRGSEKPLSHAQLQAPKCSAQRRQPDAARTRQCHIGANQNDATDHELEAAIDVIGEDSKRKCPSVPPRQRRPSREAPRPTIVVSRDDLCLMTHPAYRSGISRRQQPRDLSQERDRWFESGSLQQ